MDARQDVFRPLCMNYVVSLCPRAGNLLLLVALVWCIFALQGLARLQRHAPSAGVSRVSFVELFLFQTPNISHGQPDAVLN